MVQTFDLVLAAMRRHASLSSCVLLACLLLAPGASAQGGVDDPQVDPDSPAGTEYELPIDRARDRARGGGSGGSGGTSGAAGGQAPLFGEGVEEQAPRSGGESSTAKEAPSEQTPSSSGGADPPRTAGGRPATSTPEVARAQAPAPETGGGQLATPAAIAAGVLLIGGLAGLLLRRRSDR